MAIVIGRFIPFVRTFVPFVAGVAEMSYPRFAFYNILGAFIWVGSLTTLGYVVGDHPWVKENFSWVALAMIVVPALPAVWVFVRTWWSSLRAKRLGR